jgi:hypothetical protein
MNFAPEIRKYQDIQADSPALPTGTDASFVQHETLKDEVYLAVLLAYEYRNNMIDDTVRIRQKIKAIY